MQFTSISLVTVGLCLVSAGSTAGGLSHDLCGKTLRGGGHYTLKQDLTCGCKDIDGDGDFEALILEGPVRLNLQHNTLSCSGCAEPGTGIVVRGASAVVFNGTVSDCKLGIEVEDGNYHRFAGLTIAENLDEGIEVAEGNHHSFVSLTLARNGRSGLISDSSHSRFIDNRALYNGRRGFRIDGDYNEVRNNLGVGNDREGILIGGDKNRLFYNHTWANGRQGILIEGAWNRLHRNQAWANGRQGILVEGDEGFDNKVAYNTANRNCRDGIEIDGGGSNLITRNIANGNGNPGACPDDSDFSYGKDYRPWFYAGIDAKAGTGDNKVFHNRTRDNLGCWVPPAMLDQIEEKNPDDPLGEDRAAWKECIDDLPANLDDAVGKLRNRNLWDENADLGTDGYSCDHINKWASNWADGERNAKEECPCVEGIGEACKLAPPSL